MTFKDLAIGQVFDWIDDTSHLNSFYQQCVKLSARTYTVLEPGTQYPPVAMHVGSIDAKVFHVQPMKGSTVS